MYQKVTPVAAIGGGTLAYTGFHDVWMAVAAFVLIGAGMAILRIVPRIGRRQRQH